jgi:hypothetical protein
MALRTPPSWLQNGSHPAENDRLTTKAIYNTTGIINSTSLAITAQAVPNMTVNSASGWAAIVSSTANAGTYVAYNDATTILTITTADASLPRIDRVVVTVNDAAYSGSTNNVTFTVVAGTPAASPSAPATPSNSISLATIAVGAAVTSIVSGNITDTRVLTTTNLPVLSSTGGTLSGNLTINGSGAYQLTTSAANSGVALTSTAGTSSGGSYIDYINGSTVRGNLYYNYATDAWSVGTWTGGVRTDKLTLDSVKALFGGPIQVGAGTTAAAAIKLTSGTNLTTSVGGAIEYDGNVAYLTPNVSATNTTNGGRALLPTPHFYTLYNSRTLTPASTSAQSLLGVGVALPASTTYEIEMAGQLTATTTATSISFQIALAASGGSLGSAYVVAYGGVDAGTTVSKILSGAGLQATIYTSTTAASQTINYFVKGVVRTSTALTLTPQVYATNTNASAFGVNPGAYCKLTPIGNSTVTTIGAWA